MFLRKSLIIVFCTILLTAPLFIKGGETKKKSAIGKVGVAFMISGPEKAIGLLKSMVKEKDKYHWKSRPFTGIANGMIHGGNVSQAIEMLELLGPVFENPTDIYITLGEAYMMKSDKKKAKQCFKKVLKINPGNFSALRSLRNLDQNILTLKKKTFLEMKYRFEKSYRLKGPYLGQKPPGLTPKIFAPHLLSMEGGEVISMVTKGGSEIWFGVPLYHTQSSMMITGEKNGTWTDPEEFLFSDNMRNRDLTLSQTEDGKRIYFSAINEGSTYKYNHDMYYVEKTATGWSGPMLLPPPLNSKFRECHPFYRNGKLYFVSTRPGSLGGWDIFYSELKEGTFSIPKNMGTLVNSPKCEWDISVSPDETYLIIGSNRESPGPDSFDLFISFKDKNDRWTKPVNMGSEVNSSGTDQGAVFSPDGKYIFYQSTRTHPRSGELGYGNGNVDIYWVDAKIIDTLRKKTKHTCHHLRENDSKFHP